MSSNYEPLIPAVSAFNERGVPVSIDFNDVYHPEWGALEQARRVFIRGTNLIDRWRNQDSFTVCETGFGLGHNFLALWQAWRDDPHRPTRLHMVSFELHPFTRRDLELLWQNLPESERRLAAQLVQAWPPLLPGLHRLEFEGGALTLTLAFGSVERLARQVSARVDAYFLDGFAPRVNPEMWSRHLFGQLVRMANAGATAASWCCAGEMRRGLRDAGFLVSKVPGFGGKREITVATLRPGMGQQRIQAPTGSKIVVVGGGLAGAGVAQALMLRGHEVEVLDPVFAQGLGGSHKGHIAAALTPVISRDDDIRARLSRAGVLRALQRWQGLPEPARPRRCGTLELARDAQHAAERLLAVNELGFPSDWVRWVEADEARALTGVGSNRGGLWFADGQLVQPEPLLHALFSLPGLYCTDQLVGSVHAGPAEQWMVCDKHGQVLASAPNVVLANAWHASGLLSGMADVPGLPKLRAIYRLGGQVSNFAAGSFGELKAIVAGEGYCLPAVGKQCVGGSTYTVDPAVSQITTQGHQEVMSKIATLLSVPSGRSNSMPAAMGGWAGWRAAVTDRLPVIGPVSAAPGLWMACAFGSRGLSWAALAGDVIAAQLHGEPVPLERELLQKIAPR
ncbi:FAD-dependent 5-carboxymethylaminomethyl-2-thiouridine(34) oxidoreductase MnmC [Pollutimonas harenae]|uniref:tRNA 5-methylaminomethyl-2-thiouridine biosynthesis bifunctional protein MnmC n=1 Tax=Pollutimonas harenae TaxID=657015 RepID=A0A853GZX3_9BURK|nr:FAD-dependent 5-carboxymethylaminomethyl-2-thiouridine(34) oxidoreductase MnmC [Pollutimonas harenae]NYT86276.1 FAD-dependent 5-carboxymethylaminomethyl-2-thiouridine(34) oxidoreductase MnmC [Pollutimonas harenae]TEA69963.1 FAD-dependent oxidoreductase [Pollutimonas harenae]